MRMRRKPWVREELAESEFFIDNPAENIGKWKSLFKRKTQPLHLELRLWKRWICFEIICKKSTDKLFSNRYKK